MDRLVGVTHKKATERMRISSRLYQAVIMMRNPGLTGDSSIPRMVRMAMTAVSMSISEPLQEPTLSEVLAGGEAADADTPAEDSIRKNLVEGELLHEPGERELEDHVGEVAIGVSLYWKGYRYSLWTDNPVDSQAKSLPSRWAPLVRSNATPEESEILSEYWHVSASPCTYCNDGWVYSPGSHR